MSCQDYDVITYYRDVMISCGRLDVDVVRATKCTRVDIHKP
jgi:hypothetical protein